MKFAVFHPMPWPGDRSRRDARGQALERAVEAEGQGYHAVWLAAHPVARGIGPSIHLGAAHLAARTRRIRIGAAVPLAPSCHPLRVAEEVAVLDRLSGGRIDWGVGGGDPGQALAGPGVPVGKARSILREQLEIMRRAWRGEPLAWEGEFYRFPELTLWPTPLQEPHPPIWVAAPSPATLAWAGAEGYGVLADPLSPFHRLEEYRRIHREAAVTAGRPPPPPSPTLRHVHVGASQARAREEAGPALLRHHRGLARTGSPEPDREGFLHHLFENCAIVGDAVFCRDRLVELRERVGLDHLIAWQDFGDLPDEDARASQRRLIEKVAPALA